MTIDAPEMDVHVLMRTVDDLARTYEGVFSAETIERYVFESYTALARTATIKRYLAALARNFAADRLRALALAQGKIQSTVPQVLFVCVHNAGRSQVAAALLRHYAGSEVEVRSAGSLPASEVDPQVVEVLTARGIDMTGAFPKPLTDDVVRAADYVITMGCGDACPVYPGKNYLDWDLVDPAGQSPEITGQIIDDIDERVRTLWATVQK
ncbi:low molecular weight phosphatase family protein [Dietzia sp. NCCP-2495]|uniref:arsenate reductase ArsC n=1 Tax=Dietzia sp. NCCP-2495 TaxID=2934675 RepID=UPI002232B7CF|nr:arsenate reductase ArsC [Dietzia sp. NCCP-2495]GLB65439.1 low molecular weight phosphatase family protein [Dietzia sp. NCCP-2495]